MGGLVGMGFGALLAPPLICLLASPIASADTTDVTGTGGDITYYTFGPDTLSINDATGAFDNYIATSSFDLDIGAPGSDSFEVLLTDPSVFQLGFDAGDGSVSYIDITNSADFLPPDPCFAELGGAVGADALGGLSF
jgi:hypothetical protein